MFGKFLQSECCMKVLSWLLDHDNRYYDASIVHIECGSFPMGDFMAVLTILQGVDIIYIDDTSEDLTLKLNLDSSISQLLTHLRDEFNDLAFSSMNVSPALSYLYSQNFKNQIDGEVLAASSFELEEILDICKNYEDMEITNDMEQEIYDMCVEMKANGIYDDFIRFAESKISEKK